MLINSPLEQFEIHSIIPIAIYSLGINISFTNSSLFMVLAALTVSLVISFSTTNATFVPGRWQSFVEEVYEFVYNILNESVGSKGLKYFPLIFSIFTFILACNLLGMIPYSFTVTSHLVATLGLGLSLFIGITIIGFMEHGLHYFSLIVPQGVSKAMVPVLVVIEFIGYIVKPFSLSIRLFANMMAGHTLLKIIAGFSWSMFGIGGIFYALGIVPLLLLFVLVGLEIAIACIQAYVFTLLICSFLADAIHLH